MILIGFVHSQQFAVPALTKFNKIRITSLRGRVIIINRTASRGTWKTGRTITSRSTNAAVLSQS